MTTKFFKTGDPVWLTHRVGQGYILQSGIIQNIVIDENGELWLLVKCTVSEIRNSYTEQWYRETDVGESLFLNRKDVEAYITERKKNYV